MQMNEREELKQELEQELQWVQYRQKMLDIIDGKLLQMKQVAEQAKEENLTKEERKAFSVRLNDLAAQVKALDGESRKMLE
ncbi:hypothetical protein [Clostridium sp.]|uniref:hypothetical protein n=1 Tax=Clostridium sp. TaxID=1506 RepID=UPI00283E1E38|nr:hypothetical protein [Clostridium sp.]MDR3593993.1 hypothetical protein [Clostridium sp.]